MVARRCRGEGAGGSATFLLLVTNIRVPRHRARPVLKEPVRGVVTRGPVNEMYLGVPLRRARRGVDVVASEEGAEGQRVGDGLSCEVLVAEGDDLALGYEAGELRLSGVGETAELHATNLGARGRGQMCDGPAGAEEVWVGWVGIFAGVLVLKGLKRRVGLVLVPCGEIFGVLGESVSRGEPRM